MSCKFNGKISAEFTPPKTWVLEKGLSFTIGLDHGITKQDMELLKECGININVEKGTISCRKGMHTDLASVPRIVWNVISPWDAARAAVIHDHMYAKLREFHKANCEKDDAGGFNKAKWVRARKIADTVFLLGMNAASPSISSFKRYASYYSVRMFGWGPASG